MADTKGMARTSTRSLWQGAITFGLVHIPIGLYSATEESDVDFDWLDRRTMDPVGYKRVNKRTGEDVTELLRRSLRGAAPAAPAPPRKTAAKASASAARKSPASAKRAAAPAGTAAKSASGSRARRAA
ncbi:MAG: kulA [Ramlibacter sp.]|nr:kulA [Ramlibacter sp.]